MADITVRLNQAGTQAIANGPELRAAVLAEAERAKAIAEGLSQDFRRTGDYVSSFEINEITASVDGKTRAGAELRNTSGHAAAVEWGYAGSAAEPGHSAHHVLARTLDALDQD